MEIVRTWNLVVISSTIIALTTIVLISREDFQYSFRGVFLENKYIIPLGQYGNNLQTFDLPERNLEDKYIIYSCFQAVCGGLADRQKGIITAYLISQMLRRNFGIMMNKSCNFSNYVVPNKFDWIVNTDALNGKSSVILRTVEMFRFGPQMQQVGLKKLFPKDVTYFEANIDFVPILMKISSFSSVSWARNKTHHEIIRIAFAQLFKLAPSTLSKYKQFLSKTANKTLVCALLMMGKTKTIPNDLDFSYKTADIPVMIQFLQEKLTRSRKLFLATDSEDVRKRFQVVFSDQYTEVEGKIAHIDDASSISSYCSAMEKAILDQFILSTCHTLIMSHSGFSIFASVLRGSDGNLYLVRKNNITKSTRLDPSDFVAGRRVL